MIEFRIRQHTLLSVAHHAGATVPSPTSPATAGGPVRLLPRGRGGRRRTPAAGCIMSGLDLDHGSWPVWQPVRGGPDLPCIATDGAGGFIRCDVAG